MRFSKAMRTALSLIFLLALGAAANAAAPDCAAILTRLSLGLAEVDTAQADGAQTCRYDSVTILPKTGPSLFRFGLSIKELTITTPDWAVIDEVRMPTSLQVTLAGAHTITQTSRKATDFMINTAAARFDGSLQYSVDAVSQLASVKLDMSGRRLGLLHIEADYRQIDPNAIAQLGPSALEALQAKRLKIHFENVGVVEGYIWTFLASSTLQSDDAQARFNAAIALINGYVSTFAPRFSADAATVEAMKGIVSDFPVIQKPIDAEVVLQDPTALGAIGAALTGGVVPETIKISTFKVRYGS
jgi:hypothetical protein